MHRQPSPSPASHVSTASFVPGSFPLPSTTCHYSPMKSRMLSMHGYGTGESEGKLGMVGAILLAPLAVLPRPPSRTADTLRRLSPLLCFMSSISLPSVVLETMRKVSSSTDWLEIRLRQSQVYPLHPDISSTAIYATQDESHSSIHTRLQKAPLTIPGHRAVLNESDRHLTLSDAATVHNHRHTSPLCPSHGLSAATASCKDPRRHKETACAPRGGR